MKKPTDKTPQRRTLVLRRETITELTLPQLGKIVGGWTQDYACGTEKASQLHVCVEDPI